MTKGCEERPLKVTVNRMASLFSRILFSRVLKTFVTELNQSWINAVTDFRPVGGCVYC